MWMLTCALSFCLTFALPVRLFSSSSLRGFCVIKVIMMRPSIASTAPTAERQNMNSASGSIGAGTLYFFSLRRSRRSNDSQQGDLLNKGSARGFSLVLVHPLFTTVVQKELKNKWHVFHTFLYRVYFYFSVCVCVCVLTHDSWLILVSRHIYTINLLSKSFLYLWTQDHFIFTHDSLHRIHLFPHNSFIIKWLIYFHVIHLYLTHSFIHDSLSNDSFNDTLFMYYQMIHVFSWVIFHM